MSRSYHLAQLNIGRMKAPIEDPLMAQFVARLEDINALADRAPGFVWRLQTEGGNATAVKAYADDMIIVNMSVWETPEALRAFVYRSDHVNVMRQRKSWFERFEGMYLVLWWVPVGHVPTVAEAKARLEHLRQHGESAHAFSFASVFPSPDRVSEPAAGFPDQCPAL
jgi:hypothetical protein